MMPALFFDQVPMIAPPSGQGIVLRTPFRRSCPAVLSPSDIGRLWLGQRWHSSPTDHGALSSARVTSLSPDLRRPWKQQTMTMEVLLVALEAVVVVGFAVAVARRRGWLAAGLACAGIGLVAELARHLAEGRAITRATVTDGVVWGLILGTSAGWWTVRRNRKAST